MDENLEVYKTLFNTINEFKKLSPWKWMTNGDILGVEHPRTNKMVIVA